MKVHLIISCLLFIFEIFGQEPDTSKYKTINIDIKTLMLESKIKNTNFLPTLQKLITENKLGVYNNKFYVSNIEKLYPEVCDTLTNGVIILKKSENFINVCLGTNLIKNYHFGEDTNTNLYDLIYATPKKFRFNIEDISKIEIQEFKNSNTVESKRPRFISIYVLNNKNEYDGFSIEISDLLNYINPNQDEYLWLYEIMNGNYKEATVKK